MISLVAPFDAYKGNEPYIFVSYAHKNSDIVFQHIVKLHDAGFRIWYDEGIDPGTDWSDEIALALNNAATFLVFMSPEAAESHNVKKEIVFAVGKKKHMVCVYISETELPLGLEMQLGNIQGIPETRFINKSKFYERLFNALPASTRGENSVVNKASANVSAEDEAPETKAEVSAPIISGDYELHGTVLTRYLGSAKILTLPGNITAIGPQAFAECRSLESVIIPDGVKSIDVTAFVNCVNLVSMFIPKTVTSIAYGAFTNCNKLTVKCWRDTPSHVALKKVWRGPIAFIDDAHRAPVSSAIPTPVKPSSTVRSAWSGGVGEYKDLNELPENTVSFVPKGTAIISMTDGTEHTAIANTLLFLSTFEGKVCAYFYHGLDEKTEKKPYKCEDMVYFEDMEEFRVNLAKDKSGGTLIIRDYDGEEQIKKLVDLKEELWFISPDKPGELITVPITDTARVVFNFRATPHYSLPMALIERKDLENLLIPQAFIQLCLRDTSGVIPRYYWSTGLPLEVNGSLPIKRIKSIEITKVIREEKMYQQYTEVELIVEKRNGEVFQDKINTVISLFVLTKAGLVSPAITKIKKIIFNAVTI